MGKSFSNKYGQKRLDCTEKSSAGAKKKKKKSNEKSH